MRVSLLMVVVLAFTLLPMTARIAQEDKPVVKEAGEKLVEGIEETATGWTDIPKEIAETTEESNVIEGLTVGTVKGAGKAVVDTTKGVVKAATFFIPEEEGEEEEKE